MLVTRCVADIYRLQIYTYRYEIKTGLYYVIPFGNQ